MTITEKSTSLTSHQLPRATLSLLASGIGPAITSSIIETVHRDRISHLNLHANNLECLGFHLDQGYVEGESLKLEYLVNLDASSNKLGKQKSPPPNIHSVLSISTNLMHLNLAANQLTAASLSQLFHQGKIRLFGLKILDLSHNLLTCLPILSPPKLETETECDKIKSVISMSCPNIEALYLINNSISELPQLIEALNSHRIGLKRLKLQHNDPHRQKNGDKCSNPVCSHQNYRQYIMLALSSLLELDGLDISDEGRVNARIVQPTDFSAEIPNCSSLRKPMNTQVRDKVGLSDFDPIQKNNRSVDTSKRFQKSTECSNTNHVSVSSRHSPDFTNVILRQRSSMTKLKDLETQIDTLTDLTQKHVEATNVLLSSSNKPTEVHPSELLQVRNADSNVQTSFMTISNKQDNKVEDERSVEISCIGKDHTERFFLVFALFFACHYGYIFMKDEEYRAMRERFKIFQHKMDVMKRSNDRNKPSSAETEARLKESAAHIAKLKNDILTLSKNIEGSEEQTRIYAMKCKQLKMQEKELRRYIMKVQESEEEAGRQLCSYNDYLVRCEHREREFRNDLEQTTCELKDEQLRCKFLSDQLSELKLHNLMEIQRLGLIITQSEKEIQQLKIAFESLAKKSAEDRSKKNVLEQTLHDTKVKLQEKVNELDSARKERSQHKSEYDVVETELSNCRLALIASKEIAVETNRKETECREGVMTLTLRLEQMDVILNQKSLELEIMRDKYKRKIEKLQESEKTNGILATELEKMKSKREEQIEHNALLVETLNNEKNNLYKNMTCSEQTLKMEIENLRCKIKEMEDNQSKQCDLLEFHQRDATEKFNLLQTLATDLDKLKRQNERLVSKKERAERHAQSLAQELERERQSNHALHEQLRETNKAHESQYGKAKTFIENAYNEMIKPNNAAVSYV